MSNGRWIVAAIAVAAITAEAARADMGYLPPVNMQVRFDNLADYPDYDFYLKYGLGDGNPAASLRLMKVNHATLIKLEGEGRRLTEVYLLAVPRGRVTTPPPLWLQEKDWLREVQAGAFQSPPLYWNDGQRLENHNGCSAFYRVTIDGKQLTATWVGGEEPPKSSRLWMALAGFGLCAGIAVIGLVWIRRRRRSKA